MKCHINGTNQCVVMVMYEEGGLEDEGPAAGADDLVTCLFSFGSTGQPKPLWFDATRCAKTTPHPDPALMREH